MLYRRGADGRRASKLRSSHSNTENPLLARHRRDTSSTCDQPRRSMTTTSNETDGLYSCTADSGTSWSRAYCHPKSFGLPDHVFPDCGGSAAAGSAGPWQSTDAADCQYDRSVSVVPPDGLLAGSLMHVRSRPNGLLPPPPPPPPPLHVRWHLRGWSGTCTELNAVKQINLTPRPLNFRGLMVI